MLLGAETRTVTLPGIVLSRLLHGLEAQAREVDYPRVGSAAAALSTARGM